MEIIDVIDTAVKVGLGALISGVTTYGVTKLNHKSDKRKEAAQRTHDALVFVTEKIERYFHAFTQALSRLDGMVRTGIAPGKLEPDHFKIYIEEDEKLVESRKELLSAISRLDLLGESNAANAVREVPHFENEFRGQVVFEKKLPCREELDVFLATLANHRSKISAELSAAYKRCLV